MQVNNSIHYSSDPYLLSKYLHKKAEKAESQFEHSNDSAVDITAARLEEKLYARSINAVPATTSSTTANNKDSASTPGFNASSQQAISAYAEVESNSLPQPFSQLQEIV